MSEKTEIPDLGDIDWGHPAVNDIMQWFNYEHLPEPLRTTSEKVADLAQMMATNLMDSGPELTAGLRKLVEAKDCFVRAAIIKARQEASEETD
jgi:hypothetical protein